MNTKAPISLSGTSEEKERKRDVYAIIFVCVGVALVILSLLLGTETGSAGFLKGLGCGLVGMGIARALIRRRSGSQRQR